MVVTLPAFLPPLPFRLPDPLEVPVLTLDVSSRAHAGRDLQHRSYTLAEFAFRDDTPTGFTFEGVASVVDKPYVVRDTFGEFNETIRAGAFNKTLRDSKADVALFVNHRHADVPMASTRAGTLRLAADPNLRATADLDPIRPDVIIARSAVTRGEMQEMSIGFRVNKARDEWNDTFTERIIHEVNLVEVSIVRQGANPYTEASMRSLDEFLDSLTDVDMDEADVRRAITYFETRLPAVEQVETIINPFAERDRLEREALERKRANRPTLAA